MEIYESIFRVSHGGKMLVDYGTALANPGIVIDGSHVVEPVHFARALGQTHFARGGEGHTLEWATVEPAISLAASIKGALDHAVSAPRTIAQLVIELQTSEQWRIDSTGISSWTGDSTEAEGIVPVKIHRAVGGKITATHQINQAPSVWSSIGRRWKDL